MFQAVWIHRYKIAWVMILGIIVLGFELFTIFNTDEGDTLSENVWGLLDWMTTLGTFGKFLTTGFTVAVLGLFGWLAFHFFGNRRV